ncbi:universal stress protein [Rhodococcus triatomae]|uniref:Two-component system, OmpR family, sensor histidine kinase KdpD n=1 Tax=Rhodococcus triatomae TaxID=300028 RepID=A0A1G8FCE9_9NOCA|nr:universal stress protein [Rhodococcus triatomae]QNG19444.1 universal stress protein [Rhodococcus triatomae]QNG24642.1 universal stress protein [Rhodococcus triatomae]SDH79659.1 two-component system, OmpR family, sensor histidine kinase KdpD [Rhodococcus triatomae]
MSERILVCVNYGHNGPRLVERAVELARSADATLHVLVFDSQHEEFENDRLVDIAVFRDLASGAGASFSHIRGRAHDITGTVKRAALELGATQIVIGQRTESIWSTLLGGSVIDAMLGEIPSADLHVVPAERSGDPEDWEYETGTRAHLRPHENDTFVLDFEDDDETDDLEGIFFKDLQTDFDHGVFVFVHGGRVREVSVVDGVILAADLEESKAELAPRERGGDSS